MSNFILSIVLILWNYYSLKNSKIRGFIIIGVLDILAGVIEYSIDTNSLIVLIMGIFIGISTIIIGLVKTLITNKNEKV